jgi:hypothetical protein
MPFRRTSAAAEATAAAVDSVARPPRPRLPPRMKRRHLLFAVLAAACLGARAIAAQQVATTGARAEIRASVVSAGAIRLDGRLDEAAWRGAAAAGDFRQREPLEGAPATERTEVRVVRDATTLYIGIMAHDSTPDGVIARILQRDRIMDQDMGGGVRFSGDDAVAVLLDTFDDHRNAFVFATNPNGAEFDALITDEGREVNKDWRGIWRVAAARTADGWSAEFAIPFSTLRYRDGQSTWGINVTRTIRRKNEETIWQGWERSGGGFVRVSRAGHLTGLTDLPRAGRNIEVKPYTLGAIDHERLDPASPSRPDATRTVPAGAVGVDVKAELRPGLVLDGTVNTDFAQVEVDDQQVNLTRFSLFFPEKREFFLENAGIFQFGAPGSFGPPPFQLFFSRRIGISDDGPVPVIGGARLTGRVGGQTVGLLDIVTDGTSWGEPRTNFNVMRVKRDVGESGFVGAMLTDRRSADSSNTAGGIDFSLWPTPTFNVQGFAVRTSTSRPGGDDAAYRLSADYQTGRWGFNASHLGVGPDAEAQAGFITRTDIRQTDLTARLTFRPNRYGWRNVELFYFGNYTTRMDGLRQDESNHLALSQTWESGESMTIWTGPGRTRVDEAFDMSDSVRVPVADYTTQTIGGFFNSSAARPVSLSVFGEHQRTFGGTVFNVNSTLTVAASQHLSFGVGHTYGDVDLPNGAFRFNLASLKAGVAFTTRLFLNGVVQVNSLDREVSSNVRLQYMYRPGSDIYLVYSEGRGSRDRPWLFENRSLRLKVTWMGRL